MKNKQRKNILDNLLSTLYGDGINTELAILLSVTIQELDQGIEYSPFCKAKILCKMIDTATAISFGLQRQQLESHADIFKEQIRKAYLE